MEKFIVKALVTRMETYLVEALSKSDAMDDFLDGEAIDQKNPQSTILFCEPFEGE